MEKHPRRPVPPVDFAPRPLERLEAEIVELAGQIAGATARFVALIGEFDAREGWRDWGMTSTAHWLAWRCGLGLNAAREHVRVSRALRELPLVTESFAAGRLSYCKVRALTRFVTQEVEADSVMIAEHSTGAHIERLGAAMRRARSADEVRRRHAIRRLTHRTDGDGSVVVSMRMDPEEAAAFLARLDAEAGADPEPVGEEAAAAPTGDATRDPAAVVRLEALLRLVERGPDVSAETSPRGRDRAELVIHATADALSQPDDVDDGEDRPGAELEDGTRLHPATARRLTCDCPVSHLTETADGSPLHLGRKTRRINGRLRRAVMARDRGRCRAPACTKEATQIHHRRHWANGGTTCITNLVSLCDAHHWLVHEGGWTLQPTGDNAWTLIAPGGLAVDPAPAPTPPKVSLPADPAIGPDSVAGNWDGSPFRTGYIANGLIDTLEHTLNRTGAISWTDTDGGTSYLANPDGTPWHPTEEPFDEQAVLDWLNGT